MHLSLSNSDRKRFSVDQLRMPLIYSFVARGSTVLAEYTTYSGNFKTVALECLQNVSNPEAKFTINCDRHTFNFLNDGDFIYLAVAEESYGRTIPFGFLQRVSEEFQKKHGATAITGAEGSLDRVFGPSMKAHMEYCQEHPEEISKIASVQRKVRNQLKFYLNFSWKSGG